MNVIDALKRLERWGSEDSKAAEKLTEAARKLSEHIAGLIDYTADDLPRGYRLALGYPTLLERRWATGEYHDLFGTRRAALAFAEDIASGWLDDLATWLEQRAGESDGAAATLRRAAEGLNRNNVYHKTLPEGASQNS